MIGRRMATPGALPVQVDVEPDAQGDYMFTYRWNSNRSTVRFTHLGGLLLATVVTTAIPAPALAQIQAAGRAMPAFALPNTNVVVSVAVVEPAGLATAQTTVNVDLSSIGGPSSQQLFDEGRSEHGDLLQGDAVYSWIVGIGAGLSGSPRLLPVTLSNLQGDVGTTAIALTLGGDAGIDGDADLLPDQWEWQFGLDTTSSVGGAGAAGDADADGLTNAAELAEGSHPRGTLRRYFAEGASSSFFTTRFALFNPGQSPARVQLQFMRPDGSAVRTFVWVGAARRETVDAVEVVGLQDTAFATLVESDALVTVDRTMRWDQTGYGATSR